MDYTFAACKRKFEARYVYYKLFYHNFNKTP